MGELIRRREDLPKGRGGLDLYPRNWMQAPSYIPDGNYTNDSKLNRVNTLQHSGLAGLGTDPSTQDQNAPIDDSGASLFQQYWGQVKDVVSDEMVSFIGNKISLKIQQMGQMRQQLLQMGGMDSLINALDGDIATVNLDLQNYWQSKSYIDEFRSAWQSAASTLGLAGLRGVRGLGILPALAATLVWGAVTAISFIAGVWLVCVYKYKSQTYVLDQLASPNLTPEARASLEQVAQQTTGGGILDTIGSTLETGVQVLVIGALAYLGWQAYKNR